jgi:biopolymer transport protein TolQ
MQAELPSYHTFDRIHDACYPAVSALSQRRAADASEALLYTLGTLVLALQVQAQEGAPSLAGSGNLIDIIRETGYVNRAVLGILVLLSVVSWAIILQKAISYRSIERQTATFLDVFRRSAKFSEVQAVCPSLPASPLVGVFQAGYAELNAQFRLTGGQPQHANPATAPARPMLKSLAAVDRALLRASAVEVNKLEKSVPFLATIASAAPFIGLFGTVWGIMLAFQAIGLTGATNLATVGPGIADALIATAAGLFAAIPAVFFYNYFTTKVKSFASELDDFSLDFLNIAERNFT